MRRLALHASALSDAEYDQFTTNLREITDDDEHSASANDAYYEKMVVGVRETRAWLRGRYSHIPVSVLDTVLKLFSPNLGHGDTLTGAEFFAALRLVIHAEGGKEVDRSLAFIQVNPLIRSQSPVMRLSIESRSNSRASSPPKRLVELPPPMPLRRQTYTSASIDVSSQSSTIVEPFAQNPFAKSPDSKQHTNHPPPLHPSQRTESSKSLGSSHSAHNPFIHRPPRSEDEISTKLPPLPPRKIPPPIPTSHPPIPPPPRHLSNRNNRPERSLSPSKAPLGHTAVHLISTPPVPPKPSHHITSTLIKQSLQASKVAQSMKKAEEQLEKERVMQVLKSSSTVTGSYSLAGASVSGSSIVIGTNIHNQHQHQHVPTPNTTIGKKYGFAAASTSSASLSSGSDRGSNAPPLPRRRQQQQLTPSQQPSPPLSASSLEQVALAAPPAFPISPSPLPSYGRSQSSWQLEHDQLSPFRSPIDSVFANSANMDYSDSPQHSPTRGSVELPTGRGPPPTHPDRKPHLGPDPFSAVGSDVQRAQNLETFESIYGPISSPSMSPSQSMSGADSHVSRVTVGPMTSSSSSSADSPTARVFRSKSMHHPSPPPSHPPPPVRRKRPESVQVLGNGEVLFGSTASSLSRHTSYSAAGSSHTRRSSLSVSTTPSSNQTSHVVHEHGGTVAGSVIGGSGVGGNIQRTIEALHNIHGQLQPKLEKARYKAEAGLSRKGYVRGVDATRRSEEREGLTGAGGGRMNREHWKDGYIDDGGGIDVQENDNEFHGDDDFNEDEEWRRGRGMDSPVRGRRDVFASPEGGHSAESLSRIRVGEEKDNLKWPAGDGWKPL